MEVVRPPLEEWFERFQVGATHDFGSTMVPNEGRLSDLWCNLDPSAFGYGSTQGSMELRCKIATLEGLEPEDLVLTCGASEANALAILTAIQPGGAAIVQHPIYYQFEPLLSAHGIEVRRWLAGPDGRWRVDSQLEALLDPEVCLVVVNTPHNPTGSLVDLFPLLPLVETLPRGVVLVDEVYRGVSRDGQNPAALLSSRAISTSSFSKRWGMPGLRLGWLACRDRYLVKQALAWHEHLTHSLPRLVQDAIAMSFDQWQLQAKDGQAIAHRNRQIVTAWLAGCESRAVGRMPDVGVFLLVAVPGIEDDLALAQCLREQALFVVPGSLLGFPGKLRLGFGHRNADELVAALGALDRALMGVMSARHKSLRATHV